MLRKAATQLHIHTQSGASPSRNEGFREFEADLSALFSGLYLLTKFSRFSKMKLELSGRNR